MGIIPLYPTHTPFNSVIWLQVAKHQPKGLCADPLAPHQRSHGIHHRTMSPFGALAYGSSSQVLWWLVLRLRPIYWCPFCLIVHGYINQWTVGWGLAPAPTPFRPPYQTHTLYLLYGEYGITRNNVARWHSIISQVFALPISHGVEPHELQYNFVHSTSDGVPRGSPSLGHVASFHWSSMMPIVNTVLLPVTTESPCCMCFHMSLCWCRHDEVRRMSCWRHHWLFLVDLLNF